VHIYDAMPSLGRKFLLAGKSGLNLTYAESVADLIGRFGAAADFLAPALQAFGPDQVRDWAAGLGVDTFVGSSGRVFPVMMKASPLLRAWLGRLDAAGVSVHRRHHWLGFNPDGSSRFATPDGEVTVSADATLLALGGGSWPRLGSTGSWQTPLAACGVVIKPLVPANCGFDVGWSAYIASRYAGVPVKSVGLTFGDQRARGDFVLTRHGLEGSAVYALSAVLRDAIAAEGLAELAIDLAPDRSLADVTGALDRQPAKASLATRLRKAVGLDGVKAALLREGAPPEDLRDAAALARRIKAMPLRLTAPRPLAEAISSAGGIVLDELDTTYMLKRFPGVFAAGEMLDWEAPTGGYLLTACLATGRAAARGIVARLGLAPTGDPESPGSWRSEPAAHTKDPASR
jgi:uncharacterized flavoprotein (TIGR03862 family)